MFFHQTPHILRIRPRASARRAGAADVLQRQMVQKAKIFADDYSNPLDLTASLATPLASVVHVGQAILTSRTHITSSQGSPGDAKIDISHLCAIRMMGEVELSSALAPLSRCRIASPLAVVPSSARRRTVASLSARRRAENVVSSSLGILRAMRTAHRDEHVSHEHDMHVTMARRAEAGPRCRAHPSQAKRASARAPSSFAPCGCKQALAPPRSGVGCSPAVASFVVALGRVQ